MKKNQSYEERKILITELFTEARDSSGSVARFYEQLKEHGYLMARDEDDIHHPILWNIHTGKTQSLYNYLDGIMIHDLEQDTGGDYGFLPTILSLEMEYFSRESWENQERKGQEGFFEQIRQIRERRENKGKDNGKEFDNDRER